MSYTSLLITHLLITIKRKLVSSAILFFKETYIYVKKGGDKNRDESDFVCVCREFVWRKSLRRARIKIEIIVGGGVKVTEEEQV